jgi:hypothetical protein
MSMTCRVVVGYFDPIAACGAPEVAPTRPLDRGAVARLEATCRRVFGGEFRLAEHLRRGVLAFPQSPIIDTQTYQVVAVARGVFGMAAVDLVHRRELVLLDESSVRPQEWWQDWWRRQRPDWDEQGVAQRAANAHRWEMRRARRQGELWQRVRAFLTASGAEAEQNAAADRPRD